MFVHNIDPVLLSVGPFQVRYYGLMYVLSFLLVYWFLKKAVREKRISLSEEDAETLLLWLTAGMLVGARVFYVLFYGLGYYSENPLQIFALWQGGLSFHGGFVGALLVGYWYSLKKKVSLLGLCDVLIVPLALAQALGRFGNFTNGELFGRITDVSWCVMFPGVEGCRHPSQLYEIGYNVVIFVVLFALYKKYSSVGSGESSRERGGLPVGSLVGIFMILYACSRFVVEYFRQPELYVGPFTMGQTLSVPLLLFGAWLVWYVRKRK